MKVINKPLTKTILLIDDDEDDRMVFKMAVAEISREIKCLCSDSCQGIEELLVSVNPDLIFMDINLPRINGIECLQQIQQSAKGHRIPVVMYSSSEQPKDLMASYQKGAALYFRKPNNIKVLVEALKDILEMNWHEPEKIRSHYFKNGIYHVYEEGIIG